MLPHSGRIGFDVVLMLGTWIFGAVRFWVRHRSRPANPAAVWILSDVFVAIGLVMGTLVGAFDISYLQRRIEIEDYGPDQIIEYKLELRDAMTYYFKIALFNSYAYTTALWAAKASFLCTYHTMSKHLSKGLMQMMHLTWIALGLSWLAVMLMLTLWCRPISRNWEMDVVEYCSGQTSPLRVILVFALHIITDIPVMALPLFIIRTLRLRRRERYAIAFMFVLALATVICSTISFAFHIRFVNLEHSINSQLSIERTIEIIYIAGVIEVFISIVVVCLPSFRVAFRWLRGGHKSKNAASSSGKLSTLPKSRGGQINVERSIVMDSYIAPATKPKGYIERRSTFGRAEFVPGHNHSNSKRIMGANVSPSSSSAEDLVPGSGAYGYQATISAEKDQP